MSNLTTKQKEQLFEFKQGWVALALLLVLGYSRFPVEHWFGKGWAICMAVVAALAWFVIRPWQFGLLSNQTRRGIRLIGAIALCGFVIVALLSYWRYGQR